MPVFQESSSIAEESVALAPADHLSAQAKPMVTARVEKPKRSLVIVIFSSVLALCAAGVFAMRNSRVVGLVGHATVLEESGGRLAPFKRCGGHGMDDGKCQIGCRCAAKDHQGYWKMCEPPEGEYRCNRVVVEHWVNEQTDAAKPILMRENTTAEAEKKAEAAAKAAWTEDGKTKKIYHEAAKTLKNRREEEWKKQHSVIEKTEDELKRAKEEREDKVKEAKKKEEAAIKEAQAKFDQAKAELQKVQDEQEKIKADAKKERDTKITEAHEAAKAAKQKETDVRADASMNTAEDIAAAKKKAEKETKALMQAFAKTVEALNTKKKAHEEATEAELTAKAWEKKLDQFDSSLE